MEYTSITKNFKKHEYKIICLNCGWEKLINDDNTIIECTTIKADSCLKCSPESIRYTMQYYDKNGAKIVFMGKKIDKSESKG